MAAKIMATSKVDRKPREPIELPMRVGQRFTILSEEGDWWFIVKNHNGQEGYIPSACVKVDGRDPSSLLYNKWQTETTDLMKRGNITLAEWKLLAVPHSMVRCNELACRAWKKDANNAGSETTLMSACIHDVGSLLEAAPAYSADWLKSERLRWHPDRFGPRCAEDARAVLGKRAGGMFTVVTKLYEAELLKEQSKPRRQTSTTQSSQAHPPQAYASQAPPTPKSKRTSDDGANRVHTPVALTTRRPWNDVPSTATPNTPSLDPSAEPFRPQCTPATWTSFAERANVRKHDQKLAADPIGTFDEWNRSSTSNKGKSIDRRPAAPNNDGRQHQARQKPQTTVHTPVTEESTWQENDDERHQRLLVQARNIRARAIRRLAEEQQYRNEERQRRVREAQEQKTIEEVRRARRVRWGKQALSFEERVAEQDLQEKRKAKKERMRAAAEPRLKARLEEQGQRLVDWQDATAVTKSEERWGGTADSGMVGEWGGYGDYESGPASP